MLFLIALIITAVSIAGSAAFFSIYGLAHTFSGAFWSIIFMGISLEAGKLISASFLYRYWTKIGLWLKTYLITAVLLLMVITSTGIYGYLSNSYEADTTQYKQVEANVLSLQTEKNELMKRKTEIDKQISQLPDNYVSARQRLMKTFKPELDHINKRLPQITIEMRTLTQQQLQTEAHTGPIVFIAKSMGLSIDDATKWIVLMLIIVFDPLAVALTLAANIMVQQRNNKSIPEPPKVEEPKQEIKPQPVIIPEPKKDSTKKRGIYDR